MEKMGEIISWWLIAPVLAFWFCAVVGRYFYPYLASSVDLQPDDDGNATTKQRVGQVLVVLIGCYMAFSAGASNVANAVAPLVGSGELGLEPGILLAGGAIGLGAFTIARRTLDTVGNDLTDLPLLAALIVEVVSASIITFLSAIGIPASLAVSATMSIVGLGWGRATRTTTLTQAAEKAVSADGPERVTPDKSVSAALSADEPGDKVARIGEEELNELSASDLFNPGTTARVISLWILTPSLSAAASFLLFSAFPIYG